MAPEVLPELTWLYLNGYRNSPSVEEAAASEQLVAARGLTGRTITLFD
jgi:hypothetical protein